MTDPFDACRVAYEQGQRDCYEQAKRVYMAAGEAMTHDPLCPQQPRADGATLVMRNGKVVYCGCDLIADAIAAAVQRVEALDWDINTGMDFGISEVIAAIKGDQP